MRIILKPEIWYPKREELQRRYMKAIKQHKERESLRKEMIEITTALINHSNRHDND